MKANNIFFKVDKVGNKSYQFNKKEDSESLKTEQNIQDISGFFIKKRTKMKILYYKIELCRFLIIRFPFMKIKIIEKKVSIN
jgi:hypothetical protein